MLACAALLATALAGCVSFSVNTTGAESVEDLGAENAYIILYMTHMTQLAEDFKAFAASSDNPGPCNKGGVKQDCYDADTQAIETLSAMIAALETAEIPPRFVDADRLLREALTKNIEGLQLRNQALETGDNAIWEEHTSVLEGAQTAWTASYAAFPTDHRPPLGP